MSIRKLNLAACVLLLSLVVSGSIHAQTNPATSKREDLATMPLENVQIEAQSIGSLLSQLSLDYDIPIGLEIASYDDESVIYHFDFKKGALSDLLRQFTAEHDQYDWEINDGVVNIFPKDHGRDVLSRDLLETNISSFSIKEKTSCLALAKSLMDTPEIKTILRDRGTAYRGRNFTGTFAPQIGQSFTLDVSNVTLKTILNRVIKESPTAKFWLITRDSYDQTVYLSFSARFEDTSSKNEKPAVLQLNNH